MSLKSQPIKGDLILANNNRATRNRSFPVSSSTGSTSQCHKAQRSETDRSANREDSREIHLIVSDSGEGFDVDTALQGKGLGLTSMRERVRLVNGTILIDSKPMGGTTIHVCVPFSEQGSPVLRRLPEPQR
jgi:hypothetical protein